MENELFGKSSLRFFKRKIPSGTSPKNELCPRFSKINFFKLDMLVGIALFSLLLLTFKLFKFRRSPNCIGKLPSRKFEPRFKADIFLHFPISGGMLPSNRLPSKPKSTNFVIFPTEAGMLPLNELLLSC
jgi:hypothetical protein